MLQAKEVNKILKYTLNTYMGNLHWIIGFGLIFLLAFFIPFFARIPTYTTLGSIYLRFNSLPELTPLMLTIIGTGVIIATYLISFSVVNINLLIKSRRTMLNIPKEMLKSTHTYALRLFWIYIIQLLILWVGQVILQPTGFANIAMPLYNLIVMIPFIYAPSAIVMEETNSFNAVKRSISFMKKYWALTIFVLIAMSIITTLLTGVFLISPIYPQYIVMLANVLIILPLSIILIAQAYVSKFSIVG